MRHKKSYCTVQYTQNFHSGIKTMLDLHIKILSTDPLTVLKFSKYTSTFVVTPKTIAVDRR